MKLLLKLILVAVFMIIIQSASSPLGQYCNKSKPCPSNYTCISSKCQLTATLPIYTPVDQYYYSITRSLKSF